MDKTTVKLLLASYRPHDANDPIFAEALREVAADPELAAWFEESQRFDAVMDAKLDDWTVPADVKSHILLGYNAVAASTPRRSPAMALGALAAALALALICWRILALPRRPADALALQAISYTDRMPPLQFVCFNASAVADWVNEQPGAKRIGVSLPPPPKAMSMAMIGSSVVDWNGRPVVMLCLQNGTRMAMLYILNDAEGATLKEGSTETVGRDGWIARTTKAGGQIRVLTTKGRAEDLDFQMPF